NFPADGQAGLAAGKAGNAQRPIGSFPGGARDFHSGQTNVEVMLGPSGSVEGRILAKENGRPIAGARIRLQSATGGGEPRESVITGADGVFRFPDVGVGEFNVMATFPGEPMAEWVFLSEGVLANVEAGKTTHDVTIHASKGALLEVTVVSTN